MEKIEKNECSIMFHQWQSANRKRWRNFQRWSCDRSWIPRAHGKNQAMKEALCLGKGIRKSNESLDWKLGTKVIKDHQRSSKIIKDQDHLQVHNGHKPMKTAVLSGCRNPSPGQELAGFPRKAQVQKCLILRVEKCRIWSRFGDGQEMFLTTPQ